MILSEQTLDEIFERYKAIAIEECREKAETEYLLQKNKNEIINDNEER